MLVGCQNFPWSWRRNFVGSKIGIISINVKQMISYKLVGMQIRGQWLPTRITNIGLPRTMMIPQYYNDLYLTFKVA